MMWIAMETPHPPILDYASPTQRPHQVPRPQVDWRPIIRSFMELLALFCLLAVMLSLLGWSVCLAYRWLTGT